MKPDFRKSMIWLHTYSGLVLGWLLFTIFVTGTLSYFNPEISQWMKPELQQVSSSKNIINRSLDKLHMDGQGAQRWRIYLPDSRTEHWYLQWSTGKNRQTVSMAQEQNSELNIRETAGGNFFRIFHYTLHLRGYGGRYIAGVAAMFMLVAMFSGIFTHRRFFRDFFTLRLSKLSKTLTDFHALAGIVTIPFCLMICSSGIMIYVIMYMPWSAQHYVGGERTLSRALSPGLAKIAPQSQSQYQEPISDFSAIQQHVQTKWSGQNQIRRVTFEEPYKQGGRIIVERVKAFTLSRQSERLVFSTSGQPLAAYPESKTASEVRRVFFGLHEAHFAKIGLRWLLFLMGLISSALIATGLIIWLNKRLDKVKSRHVGHFLVEKLNIAAIAGLPLAIIAFFLSNRLIPVELANRADAEVQVFLCSWLLALLHAFIRHPRKAWIELLAVTAFGCFMLPIIDMYADYQRLFSAFSQMDFTYLGFVGGILATGVTLLKVVLWLKSRPMVTSKPSKEISAHVR